MSTAVKPLPELVKELPPYAERVVRDFAEFLLMKHRAKMAINCVKIGPVSCVLIAISTPRLNSSRKR